MIRRIFVLFLVAVTLLSLGCADTDDAVTEELSQFKEIIGYRLYIDRVEETGQRTIVVVVSPTATREQVRDLADFLINDSSETKVWVEVWDDLETLQKGQNITEQDKKSHYILNATEDKSANKREYGWLR